MVRLRLQRKGTKKIPFYRIVAAEKTKARCGKVIEIIGTYNPLPNPSLINLDEEKAKKWLANGAQPSERVIYILKQKNILVGSTKK